MTPAAQPPLGDCQLCRTRRHLFRHKEARRLLDATKGPSISRCADHPTGPTDPTDGLCLLCRGRRHRAQLQAAAVAPALGDVARTLAEHGETEAVRRHGPRAVARAQAACGRSTQPGAPLRHDSALTGYENYP
ncbi:hypothetical protein [Streptomyces sp. NPDC047985]|uniref:hypothetical protein n=1 Tax=unclassified Streptomyces TaxID=2593676 RepID=UPI0034318BEC